MVTKTKQSPDGILHLESYCPEVSSTLAQTGLMIKLMNSLLVLNLSLLIDLFFNDF